MSRLFFTAIRITKAQKDYPGVLVRVLVLVLYLPTGPGEHPFAGEVYENV
jgi:hypothetical protein